MGFSPFWEDDEEEAARIAAEQAVGIDAARDYISKESSRLQSEFQAKYDAAQSEFSATAATLAKKETDINNYLTTKEASLNQFSTSVNEKATFTDDVIQKFNSAGQQASIAASNNGKPVKYSVATQPIEKPGPSPVVIIIAAVVAYFVFFKKGS